MTDRELLELAALAAGIPGRWVCVHGVDIGQDLCGISNVTHPRWGEKVWNPLADDGDALRLAVKLHLALLFPMHGDTYKQCGAGQVGGKLPACMEPHSQDPYAATRRAIVRAAAEIGKSMTGQSNHPAKVA